MDQYSPKDDNMAEHHPFRARASTLDAVFLQGQRTTWQKWRRRSSPEMPYGCLDAGALLLRLVLPGKGRGRARSG